MSKRKPKDSKPTQEIIGKHDPLAARLYAFTLTTLVGAPAAVGLLVQLVRDLIK